MISVSNLTVVFHPGEALEVHALRGVNLQMDAVTDLQTGCHTMKHLEEPNRCTAPEPGARIQP